MPHLLPVSFHSLESSSSLSSTCRRRLSTSQPLSVKRPQKPFPQPIPYIDEHGIFHRPGYNQPIKQVEYLGGLARGGLTLVEKYGSVDGFGLKNGARTDDAAKTEDVGSGKRDWARELGLSLRRKRRMLSSTQFITESKTVNRSSGGEKPMAYKGGSFGLLPRSRRETAGEGGEESEISQSQRPGIGRGKSINADLHGEAKAASERSSPGLEHTSYPTRDPIGRETSAGLRSTPPRSPQFFPRSPSRTGYSRSFRTGPQYGLKTISPDDDDSSSVQLRHLKSTPPSRSPPLHSNLPPPAYRPPRPPFDPNELIDADIDADVDADAVQQQSATPGKRRWQPTKKLTFAAMAGLKALHTNDPHNFTRSVLSERFGISVEAVRRILKSDFRQSDADGAGGDIEARPATKARSEDVGRKSLRGSKWDRNNLTSESYSPVPAIMRAYGNLHARPKHPESK